MKQEIEILAELITDIGSAKKVLAPFYYVGTKHTLDHYFFDPLRDNLQLNSRGKLLECCRIRVKGDECFMTYKTDVYEDHVWLLSNEHEIRCTNSEGAISILKQLGLEKLVTVDNTKHIFRTEQYEIVLEEVKELGNFVEVEFIGEGTNLTANEIKSEMRRFISKLQLAIGAELNSGKPELLLLKQRNSLQS